MIKTNKHIEAEVLERELPPDFSSRSSTDQISIIEQMRGELLAQLQAECSDKEISIVGIGTKDLTFHGYLKGTSPFVLVLDVRYSFD